MWLIFSCLPVIPEHGQCGNELKHTVQANFYDNTGQQLNNTRFVYTSFPKYILSWIQSLRSSTACHTAAK
jgi:hypothetical protein